ncbi:hypothetical protein NQ315_016105, partial [Exocentrus adspersus]
VAIKMATGGSKQNDGMSLGESDVELDFEPDQGEHVQVTQHDATEAIVAKVLETQLAGRIATIIEQQAAQAIERAVARTAGNPSRKSSGVHYQGATRTLNTGPEELRANAYACRCTTPEDLYSQFLTGLENYKFPRVATGAVRKGESYSAVAKARRPSPVMGEAKRPAMDAPRRFRCYNGQEYGTHLSRDCPKPRQERCSYCGKEGHFFERCPRRGRQRGDPGTSNGGEKGVTAVKVRLGNRR